MTSIVFIVWIFCWLFSIFSIAKAIFKAVRTYLKSKKLGIIKACIQRAAVVVTVVSVSAFVLVMCVFWGEASQARNSAAQWEGIKGSENSEYYTEYYNDMLSGHRGTEITDFDKFADGQVIIYQNQAERYASLGMITALLAALMIAGFFEKIFYLTESGLLSAIMNEPEEFVVRTGNRKLGIYFKNGPNNTRYLVEFRETPDDLAKLGRFIEWNEEADNVSETGTLNNRE